MKRYANLLFISLIFVSALSGPVAGRGPQPGDLYREFATHNAGDRDWRITDDQAVRKFERGRAHLPNARVEIRIDDLEHAIRAEAMLDRWGGQRGSSQRAVRGG